MRRIKFFLESFEKDEYQLLRKIYIYGLSA